jgi:hypothetical protein
VNCPPFNIAGKGVMSMRGFEALIGKCEIWLEDISYEFAD